MTKLMAWAALAGAVIGLVFLGAGVVAARAYLDSDSSDYYGGSYAPLTDLESTSAFDTSLGLDWAANWWDLLTLPWWSYPLIGAGSAAVLSVPFAIVGVRVSRVGR
ncbi:hypothetical protein HQ325_03070 [Rhodococcus sp. BP-349]|uniref:hypothetical protein n=1 Tax=unclassified Rhodococcus (in: high G+C Gram-positive bacteria) TaxID=192944 RepID=UPI001C9B20AF|nr:MULTISPECIES: hypothetical protein [unclassified Rhodococcus (in: high G+C Gram-positive bacteria)]MBY6537645.1 hypothetical protein [Rhodococcus sp. BP-363]MBY6541982.1 hypothetical protein [Rhodococcus sp. BP-369]MBY6561212.1 hypothetical protein [Rhodococcus sp. BP-370]MBY6575504.1 hypothetical protein [Rhodococcus sp. BP-364]MBY6584805.1 hypothetical protein [Rhodococcus sp. BP-358]